ncbi:FkbM family methyltransferase [Algoriphagus aestuariicola]|uniref:FkbM family methyltransferase n=1 Tax=Algoriphagus aestuariicola TaxID=1852016 RepID=UPI00293D75EF|nr:FkbM family methyltransferase [Algoriphagus aestuariicola]
MSFSHHLHKIKSYLIDRRPFGHGRILKLIDRVFFDKIPSGEILTKTLYGFPLFIQPSVDRGLEKKIFFTGTYEKGLLHVLDCLLTRGDTVVDAGANIGLISVFCGLRVGKDGMVMAFEPHPETIPILRRNIEVNGLSQVAIYECALGRSSGTAKIYSNLQINRGAASMVDFVKGAPSFDIRVAVLDNILSELGPKRVRLLKVDVEGFEMEVLKGAKMLLSCADGPILVIECSLTRLNFQYSIGDLFWFLTEVHHYKVFRFSISKERISRLVPVHSADDLPHHDNIFAFKQAHLSTLHNKNAIF